MLVEKLDNKGRGICFVNNKITFVSNALPFEDIDVKIVDEKKKYNEGIVLKYNSLSNDRVKPICPYFDICGGCDLMHLNYEKELKFKKNKVEDILKKFGDIDIVIEEIISPMEYNYRNKATFKVKENIGYYKKKSYDVIKIDECKLVDDRINKILNDFKNCHLENICEVVIRCGLGTMLYIKANGKIDPKIKELDVDNIIVNDEIIKGVGYIKEKIENLEFIISKDSFFQVNTRGAYSLYDKVKSFADLKGNEKILDLYCGTGTIGIYLANNASYVTGIEINKSAVLDAIENKKINNIRNIDFICGDAKLADLKDIDLVIVDPPRSGLDEKTIKYLQNLNTKKIIYVSCNPVTLARDLKELDKYKLKKISLVNMFPKTEHVESVSLLELK